MATTSNEKVKFGMVESATVPADNSLDSSREYNIRESVSIRGNSVESLNGGIVEPLSGGSSLAVFNQYMGSGLNITFMNDVETSAQCSILSAVNEHIKAVKDKIASNASQAINA